jgi:hypothetical protein
VEKRGGVFAVKTLNQPSGMWRNYENSMQRYTLIHNKPTYTNIPDVEKISYPTSNQALRSNANQRQNPNHQ